MDAGVGAGMSPASRNLLIRHHGAPSALQGDSAGAAQIPKQRQALRELEQEQASREATGAGAGPVLGQNL